MDTTVAITQSNTRARTRQGPFWRITAIARNAFREAVRDRVLYNLVLFVLLLIVAAIFIGELSGGQERKVIVDLGLSAMLLFGVFISIFVGVGLVYKEIERNARRASTVIICTGMESDENASSTMRSYFSSGSS